MKSRVLYSTLLLLHVVHGRVGAQDRGASWFPAQVGDKWIYQNESRDGKVGGMAHLTITRWRTTETIIRTFKIPEGTVIVKHVTAMDSVPEAIQDRQS